MTSAAQGAAHRLGHGALDGLDGGCVVGVGQLVLGVVEAHAESQAFAPRPQLLPAAGSRAGGCSNAKLRRCEPSSESAPVASPDVFTRLRPKASVT